MCATPFAVSSATRTAPGCGVWCAHWSRTRRGGRAPPSGSASKMMATSMRATAILLNFIDFPLEWLRFAAPQRLCQIAQVRQAAAHHLAHASSLGYVQRTLFALHYRQLAPPPLQRGHRTLTRKRLG